MPRIINNNAGCAVVSVAAHHYVTRSKIPQYCSWCWCFFCRCRSSSSSDDDQFRSRIMNQNSEFPATLGVWLLNCCAWSSAAQTEHWQGQYCLTSFNIYNLTKFWQRRTQQQHPWQHRKYLFISLSFLWWFDINVWSLTVSAIKSLKFSYQYYHWKTQSWWKWIIILDILSLGGLLSGWVVWGLRAI